MHTHKNMKQNIDTKRSINRHIWKSWIHTQSHQQAQEHIHNITQTRTNPRPQDKSTFNFLFNKRRWKKRKICIKVGTHSHRYKQKFIKEPSQKKTQRQKKQIVTNIENLASTYTKS